MDILKADIIGSIDEARRDTYTEMWQNLEDERRGQAFPELFGHIRMIHRKQKMRESLVNEFTTYALGCKPPEKFIDDDLLSYADAFAWIVEKEAGCVRHNEKIDILLRPLEELAYNN